MGKSILDAAVEYESATKQSLLDAANNFPVKKKESAPLYDQNFDLRSGVPLSQNGGINGQKTLLSKSQSPLLSDTNPINQVLNNDITQSNKKVFDNAKSFLDNDIQVQTNLQLKNVSAPQDKFSLQNIPSQQNNTIQSVNPQVKSDAAKAAIFNNPEALKDYRKKRQSEIDSQISQLEKEAAPYEQGDVLSDPSVKFGISSGILNDPKKQEEINSLKEYRSQFDKSIQDAAKISIPQKYIKNNIPIDLKQIGQEYFQVTGDNQINDDINVLQNIGNQYKTGASIKTPDGIIIPGKTNQKDIDVTKQNIQYRLYQQGANVMADYFSTASDNMFDAAKPKLETLSALIKNQDKAKDQNEKDLYQRQINSFLEDESVKNYLDATRQALDYTTKSKDAINQFPQVKRQQLRQQVNDVFMDMVWNKKEDNKIPFATGVNALTKLYESLVGSTPDKEQVQNIAKRLGLSEKEIQDIADEKNEGLFGVTPSGIRASGLLQGLAKGTDEQLAKSLMGVRRFFDTDNAETKNRLLQDKLNVYNTEGQKNKIKDDFNKWNINPYSIFNTMGRGVGQTAVFAVPSLVTGGLAGEGTIGEKLLEAATTIGSGYAGSYEDAYKEAAKYTDKEDLRRSYANITAYENALPELLLSPADIAKKISGLKKVGSKQAFETFAKEATEKGIQDATRQRMGAALKEFANVIGAENIEEQVTNVANNITKEQMFGVKMSPTDWVNQAIETAVQTTITTLPLGIGAGINGTNDISGVRKEGLFEAGNEPDLYKQKLQDLFDKGDLTQDQLNERTQVVNIMQQIVANVNKATKPNGKPLNYDEKKDLAAQQFRIQSNEKLSENGNLLTAQENQIKEDNKEALDIQNKILFGTKETEEKPEDKMQPVPEKKEEIKIPEPPKVKGEPEDISKQIELSTEITIPNETEVKKAEVLPEQTNEGVKFPTDEQLLKDIKEKNFATFTYNSESEVPEILRDKISSTGEMNGKKFVRVTLPKSEADYYLSKGEKLPNETENKKIIQPQTNEGTTSSNEPKPAEESSIAETKPIEDIQGTEIIKKGIKETNNYENFRKSTGVSDAEIKLVPLDEIEKYVFVNRKENPKAEDYAINGLAESIKEKGWREPIQFSYDDKHGVVIEGNTRVQAAKELGLKEIPVWFHKVKKATPNENGELIPLIEFTKKELPKSEQPSQNITSPINTEQGKQIFEALDKVSRKKSEAGKTKAFNEVQKSYGEEAVKAKFINDNFDNILKQLNIEKKC